MTTVSVPTGERARGRRGTRETPAHRRIRRLSIALGVLFGLVIAIRLLLDPIAAHATRRALDNLDGFRGNFARVHVGVFPPSYEISRLALSRRADGDAAEPIVYAERARAIMALGPLLRGRKIASLRVEHPKVVILNTRSRPKKEEGGAQSRKPAPPPDLSRQLRAATSLKVDRVEILDGEPTRTSSCGRPCSTVRKLGLDPAEVFVDGRSRP